MNRETPRPPPLNAGVVFPYLYCTGWRQPVSVRAVGLLRKGSRVKEAVRSDGVRTLEMNSTWCYTIPLLTTLMSARVHSFKSKHGSVRRVARHVLIATVRITPQHCATYCNLKRCGIVLYSMRTLPYVIHFVPPSLTHSTDRAAVILI